MLYLILKQSGQKENVPGFRRLSFEEENDREEGLVIMEENNGRHFDTWILFFFYILLFEVQLWSFWMNRKRIDAVSKMERYP